MKRQAGKWILIISFGLILCLGWIWQALFDGLISEESHENRNLAAFPVIRKESPGAFLIEFEAYINDHIPFRSHLITMNKAIDYFIFHSSADPDVIPGKDNWLFYAATQDGDSIGSYLGTNLLTENQTAAFMMHALAIRNHLAAEGIDFFILVAPNKERVYSEYMPEAYGRPSKNYPALQLISQLRKETNLQVIYPLNELESAKTMPLPNIYYRQDTHWNQIGAYIGARTLLESLNTSLPEITNPSLQISRTGDRAGDLADMLNIGALLQKYDDQYEVRGYELPEGGKKDSRRILVVHDSFGNGLKAPMNARFENIQWLHYNNYEAGQYREWNPDIIIYETVERYLPRLGDFEI